ncbi:Putative 2-hydroxyacid dehydrogenase YoaD [Pontiella desulfatans]|uniref:2-hydroxyacid dehydrogenase YoaD n=1 Tax=Pontiella desulfatans TaxID=2750659 RepID=A0A6C2U910_PONDE|nr:NAD(P)-dependent oxidoreductase [Pontiella desulfatans]VGO16540.1 Putative 2-hydroxyacid dehydrogenase YoaD [Pontiella desulfatans]
MKTAFFNRVDPVGNTDMVDQVYADRQQLVAEISDLYPVLVTPDNFEDEVGNLQDLEVVFCTWRMLDLTEEQIDRLPNLKAILYAAGSVKNFAVPYLERGIKVCSAIEANGVPVAELALAQVLLAGAGFWRNSRECVDHDSTFMGNNHRGHGNYDNRVSILGNGTISNHLQALLAHHKLEVVVVPSRESNRTVSLEEAFSTSVAVVNLFPDRDDNVGVFDGKLFGSMLDSATFINVGRGRQVNEPELIQVMKERPDLTALLDVQHPEPPVDGSELYTVPNILLSGHIAGSKGTELRRMADYMVDEYKRLAAGEALKHEVDLETVRSMA